MKMFLIILHIVLSFSAYAGQKLEAIDLYQDLGTFYCGTKRHTCEHYYENSIYLTVKKGKIALVRNVSEAELPMTIGFSGEVRKPGIKKVMLTEDKKLADEHIKSSAGHSPRQKIETVSKGLIEIELQCNQGKKQCQVKMNGDVSYGENKSVYWMKNIELDCNRKKLKDETLPQKELEKLCAESEG